MKHDVTVSVLYIHIILEKRVDILTQQNKQYTAPLSETGVF